MGTFKSPFKTSENASFQETSIARNKEKDFSTANSKKREFIQCEEVCLLCIILVMIYVKIL